MGWHGNHLVVIATNDMIGWHANVVIATSDMIGWRGKGCHSNQ